MTKRGEVVHYVITMALADPKLREIPVVAKLFKGANNKGEMFATAADIEELRALPEETIQQLGLDSLNRTVRVQPEYPKEKDSKKGAKSQDATKEAPTRELKSSQIVMQGLSEAGLTAGQRKIFLDAVSEATLSTGSVTATMKLQEMIKGLGETPLADRLQLGYKKLTNNPLYAHGGVMSDVAGLTSSPTRDAAPRTAPTPVAAPTTTFAPGGSTFQDAPAPVLPSTPAAAAILTGAPTPAPVAEPTSTPTISPVVPVQSPGKPPTASGAGLAAAVAEGTMDDVLPVFNDIMDRLKHRTGGSLSALSTTAPGAIGGRITEAIAALEKRAAAAYSSDPVGREAIWRVIDSFKTISTQKLTPDQIGAILSGETTAALAEIPSLKDLTKRKNVDAAADKRAARSLAAKEQEAALKLATAEKLAAAKLAAKQTAPVALPGTHGERVDQLIKGLPSAQRAQIESLMAEIGGFTQIPAGSLGREGIEGFLSQLEGASLQKAKGPQEVKPVMLNLVAKMKAEGKLSPEARAALRGHYNSITAGFSPEELTSIGAGKESLKKLLLTAETGTRGATAEAALKQLTEGSPQEMEAMAAEISKTVTELKRSKEARVGASSARAEKELLSSVKTRTAEGAAARLAKAEGALPYGEQATNLWNKHKGKLKGLGKAAMPVSSILFGLGFLKDLISGAGDLTSRREQGNTAMAMMKMQKEEGPTTSDLLLQLHNMKSATRQATTTPTGAPDPATMAALGSLMTDVGQLARGEVYSGPVPLQQMLGAI